MGGSIFNFLLNEKGTIAGTSALGVVNIIKFCSNCLAKTLAKIVMVVGMFRIHLHRSQLKGILQNLTVTRNITAEQNNGHTI